MITRSDREFRAGAIGAFEGADHFDCGIFRPALTCKMRENAQPFCQVCEVTARLNLGHYMLVQGRAITMPAGAWTHMKNSPLRYQPAHLGLQRRHRRLLPISDNLKFSSGDRRPDGTPPLDVTNPSLGQVRSGSTGPVWFRSR